MSLPDPPSAFSITAAEASVPSPRAVLLAALFDGARDAALTGDLAAARVAHEAIGKLLGAAAPGEGVEGVVLDLGSARRKRSE